MAVFVDTYIATRHDKDTTYCVYRTVLLNRQYLPRTSTVFAHNFA